jgi:hypothetical protein
VPGFMKNRFYIFAVIVLGVVVITGCGSPKTAVKHVVKPSSYPATGEAVIRAYYQAINDGDYAAARTYLSSQMTATAAQMKQSYSPYIKSVAITRLTRQPQVESNGEQVFDVTFKAVYYRRFPVGNGALPTVHVLQKIGDKWKIIDIVMK